MFGRPNRNIPSSRHMSPPGDLENLSTAAKAVKTYVNRSTHPTRTNSGEWKGLDGTGTGRKIYILPCRFRRRIHQLGENMISSVSFVSLLSIHAAN